MSHRSRVTALLAAALVATSLAAVWVSPADAATGTAPVAVADVVTVAEGASRLVDVLANDSDADGDELAVCRIGDVPEGLDVEVLGEGPVALPVNNATGKATETGTETGQLLVVAFGRPGTYTVTYYACDFSYLSASTLTVQIVKPPQIKIRVSKLDGRPGKLKVVNRSGFAVQFFWGSYRADRPDGVVTVGRRSSVITVRRRSILWAASSRRTTDFAFGRVRDIRVARGTDPLPPGAPDGPLTGQFAGRLASS